MAAWFIAAGWCVAAAAAAAAAHHPGIPQQPPDFSTGTRSAADDASIVRKSHPQASIPSAASDAATALHRLALYHPLPSSAAPAVPVTARSILPSAQPPASTGAQVDVPAAAGHRRASPPASAKAAGTTVRQSTPPFSAAPVSAAAKYDSASSAAVPVDAGLLFVTRLAPRVPCGNSVKCASTSTGSSLGASQ
jgi:hypothetical protein